MTARDELRGTLSNIICNASNYTRRAQPYLLGSDMSTVLDKTADAILAAGYRKPRTIEHAHADDGSDELPPLSVVLSGGKPVIKQYDHTFMDWDGSTWDSWELEYPITVIHEGAQS